VTADVWLVEDGAGTATSPKFAYDSQTYFETACPIAEHVECHTGLVTGRPIRSRAAT